MKPAITFIFISTLCLFGTHPLSAQWINQGAGLFQAESWVEVLQPINSNVVWATIDNYEVFLGNDTSLLPRIIRSTDGGQTWQQDSIPGTEGCMALGMSALSKDTAWVTFYNGRNPAKSRLYQTIDSGNSWQPKFQPDTVAGLGVHFFDAEHGLIFRGSKVRITNDGGATWQIPASLPTAINKNIYNYGGDAFTAYKNNVWIPLADGRVLKTTDQGNHWSLLNTPLVGDSVSFNCIAFTDAQHGLAVGIFTNATYSALSFSRVFRTEDGGTTWSEVASSNLPPQGFFGAVEEIPGTTNTFIMFGVNYFVGAGEAYDYVTHDGGLSWQKVGNGTPETREIYKFLSDSVGWSGNGYLAPTFGPNMLFKWNGGSLVDANEPNAPVFEWEQFPNPAKDWFQVRFPAGTNLSDLNITLYDHAHHFLSANSATVETVDVHTLPAGVYYTLVRRGQKLLGIKQWVKI
ncbi:MAG: T9SS type A sorting domain-containing protein [Bacteroidota bacterium]